MVLASIGVPLLESRTAELLLSAGPISNVENVEEME